MNNINESSHAFKQKNKCSNSKIESPCLGTIKELHLQQHAETNVSKPRPKQLNHESYTVNLIVLQITVI